MNINILLFEDFTALDVFGPVEVLGSIEDFTLRYLSLEGGIVTNRQNIKLMTERAMTDDLSDAWLIPGGFGTRTIIHDESFIGLVRAIAESSRWCLTVCTGSALLARTGALDGRHAATNRRAFEWVRSMGERVLWEREARYVHDGKFWTSAGVSAGIDMSLAFVSELYGRDKAEDIAGRMEYEPSR